MPLLVADGRGINRSARALLALALVLGTCATVQARAAAAGGEPTRRVTLGGTTVVEGDQSGFVPVRLPRDARVSIAEDLRRPSGPNPDIRTSGAGRFVGFALVEDPYPEIRNEGRFLMAGRFGDCAEEGCRPARVTNVVQPLNAEGPELTLKKGNYRLYLVADGAPASVKLRLHGLGGRARIAVPAKPVVDLQSPATRLDVDDHGGRVWSAGSSFQGGQVGFSLSVLTVRTQQYQGMDLGFCQFNALEPPPPEVAYGPHCQTLVQALGSGAALHFDDEWDRSEFITTASFGYNANENTVGVPNLSGVHGLGAWVRSDNAIDSVSFQGLFVQIS